MNLNIIIKDTSEVKLEATKLSFHGILIKNDFNIEVKFVEKTTLKNINGEDVENEIDKKLTSSGNLIPVVNSSFEPVLDDEGNQKLIAESELYKRMWESGAEVNIREMVENTIKNKYKVEGSTPLVYIDYEA